MNPGNSHDVALAHVPSTWQRSLSKILAATPVRFELVSTRSSVRGTCLPSAGDTHFLVRINKDSNVFRFGLTLLHEIAHVHAQIRYGREIQPHGWEWKQCYSDLLYQFWFLFPTKMQKHVIELAKRPFYSTDAHTGLSRELALFEAEEHMLFASDLKVGELFTVESDDKVLRRGPALRKRIICFGPDEKEYTVSMNARVRRID